MCINSGNHNIDFRNLISLMRFCNIASIERIERIAVDWLLRKRLYAGCGSTWSSRFTVFRTTKWTVSLIGFPLRKAIQSWKKTFFSQFYIDWQQIPVLFVFGEICYYTKRHYGIVTKQMILFRYLLELSCILLCWLSLFKYF